MGFVICGEKYHMFVFGVCCDVNNDAVVESVDCKILIWSLAFAECVVRRKTSYKVSSISIDSLQRQGV
jgi:hypothetical protein